MILAFHGEPSLKAAVMDRLRQHQRMDEIVQHVYYQDGKGCHLGCLTHASSNTHEAAERLFGIDQSIGYWLETVFEGLHNSDCARWVIESTAAIPAGADLSKCHHHFLAWLLGDSGLLAITAVNRESIDLVRRLHSESAVGTLVPADEWSAAAASARSAAAAARSAAWIKIATKSIEIFAAAPVVAGSVLSHDIERELCCRNMWCRDARLIEV